jgi:hypothetical protein
MHGHMNVKFLNIRHTLSRYTLLRNYYMFRPKKTMIRAPLHYIKFCNGGLKMVFLGRYM